MRVLLVPDKFKESLTAQEVCGAISEGMLRAIPDLEIISIAASDGGNGFLEAIASKKALEWITSDTVDPLNRPIKSQYIWDPINQFAYVELARASGLELLKPLERNPMLTSTLGTGLQLRDALTRGAKKIFIGLGGSATNDGGIGIAAALGYSFVDEAGKPLAPIGRSLEQISAIEKPIAPVITTEVEFIAVNDVNNPLWGPKGAAAVYAPQKGADIKMVHHLDQGLQNLDSIVARDLGILVGKVPGSGAAGGAAFGLMAFLGAGFVAGTEFIITHSGLRDLMRYQEIDIIITGEGKIDEQSLNGKFIQGILGLGAEFGIPVGAVCGSCTLTEPVIKSSGMTWVIAVSDKERTLSWNLQNAYWCTVNAVTTFFESY
ncbi:MAG: hypothetical protein RLZZ241_2537 [Bacteroidota bacterium]|jgi:glycerate kinase